MPKNRAPFRYLEAQQHGAANMAVVESREYVVRRQEMDHLWPVEAHAYPLNSGIGNQLVVDEDALAHRRDRISEFQERAQLAELPNVRRGNGHGLRSRVDRWPRPLHRPVGA